MSVDRVEHENKPAPNRPDASAWRAFWRQTLLLFSVLSLALGVVFFIAWNWAQMDKFAKFALLQGGIALCLAIPAFIGTDSRTDFFCLLGGGLLVGPLLAVYGQAYQSGAQLWELLRVWSLTFLPLALAGRKTALFFLFWLTGSLSEFLRLGLPISTGIDDLLWRNLPIFQAVQCSCALLWEGAAHFWGASRPWLNERWFPRLLFFVALSSVTLPLAHAILFDRHNAKAASLFSAALYLALAAWAWFWHLRGKRDIFMPACGLLGFCVMLVALLLRGEFLFDAGTAALLGWALLIIALSAGAGMLLRSWQRTMKNGSSPPNPWFITFFQGLAGWIAALLLIVFAIFLVTDFLHSRTVREQALLLFGAVMLGLGAATGKGEKPFPAQFSLASALAGAGCVSVALIIMADRAGVGILTGRAFLAASLGPLAGYFLVRGFPFRLLAAFGFFSCLFLGLILELFSRVAFDFPDLALALSAVCWTVFCLALARGRLSETLGARCRPGLHGLYLALLFFALCSAALLAATSKDFMFTFLKFASNAYLLPLFSNPLGAASGLALVYLVHTLTGTSPGGMEERDPEKRRRFLAAACLAVPAGWFLPGLSLGLLGLALCRLENDRPMTGVTALFLFCVIGCYYYSLSLSLLHYALLLLGSGLVMSAVGVFLAGPSAAGKKTPPAPRGKKFRLARAGIIAATLVLLLAGFNLSARRQETLLREGAVVFLETAPVDPRALLLGDYMSLDWRVNRDATAALREREEMPPSEEDIMIVVRLNADRVASFSRLDGGGPLADDELRLRGKKFRRRHGGISIRTAASAFFFQEGHARAYEAARYGELRVDKDGGSLLVALRDARLRPISPGEK
ncbi:MAG: GDYXXLXY domain-containing protein [Desulfovibrio sp.]|nr:GDYXXLXY domain-containing protein [Desulfovibrio sp.]